MTLDDIDKEILRSMRDDARISNAELGRRIGLAPSAVLERIRKLEDRGVIRGYATLIDSRKTGWGLTAFVFVKTRGCSDGFFRSFAEIPEVLELHDIAGDDCYILKVKARDTEDLGRTVREKIRAVENVISTRTTVVLETLKESTSVPIDVTSVKKRTAASRPRRPKAEV